ncbi:uncharacterized protein LOC142165992 [Nicotiana tabacum]|uniref:Uncharacterized protein LOC142165992 n=1 Tax=Nicotiana tabacum TaxID=4097 RepID=A0AC58S677_TOBAC
MAKTGTLAIYPSIFPKKSWTPYQRTPKGWFKLNIDASFNKNLQKCGLGGVIRNANGHWIVGYAKSAHARGSLHSEIKALLAGLKTTLNWGMFPLQIETDSTEVVNAPTEACNHPSRVQARE